MTDTVIDDKMHLFDEVQWQRRSLDQGAKFYVAGHKGLVGSAIWRNLEKRGFTNLVGLTSSEMDLKDERAVLDFFEREQPVNVVLAAAKVGGILANSTYPVDFLSDNLRVQLNVLEAARLHGVDRLLFLGSSCVYPKFAPQPILEDSLLTGALEGTNDAYAIAKIAGIKLCQAYRRQYGFNAISLMPTNLYGPGDNFSPKGSHVLPALIQRYYNAAHNGDATVTNWGTGTPRREFLHVDDMAAATVFLTQTYEGEDIVNVGVGNDISIRELAELVGRITGFEGEIVNDTSKPDGTPRKLLDVSRLHALGWQAQIGLQKGITATYRWFLEHQAEVRG